MAETDLATRLGNRFEVRAICVGDRIDVRGIDPRLSQSLPVIIEVAPAGYAVLLRAGAVVLFGIDPIQQERFITDLGSRITGRHDRLENERATVRVGEADGIEPDAVIMKEITIERLQVLAEILGKSVILSRHEAEIADTFTSIEPMAAEMKRRPNKLPFNQPDLVKQIGGSMLVEHELVGRAEVLEKPELLWDRPDLDRLYARLEDEYELRERVLVLERKVEVVSGAARTMLELHQAKRSLNVEYYIVLLIVLELVVAIVQLVK
ncbi:MAG TPA: RMD1 family protein [Kofleriaceae bacterium]|jgi:uncharacterized Rmd1/YagE family protein|nr:RMD1 family protein [Kofleriaceae bacterium]